MLFQVDFKREICLTSNTRAWGILQSIIYIKCDCLWHYFLFIFAQILTKFAQRWVIEPWITVIYIYIYINPGNNSFYTLKYMLSTWTDTKKVLDLHVLCLIWNKVFILAVYVFGFSKLIRQGSFFFFVAVSIHNVIFLSNVSFSLPDKEVCHHAKYQRSHLQWFNAYEYIFPYHTMEQYPLLPEHCRGWYY